MQIYKIILIIFLLSLHRLYYIGAITHRAPEKFGVKSPRRAIVPMEEFEKCLDYDKKDYINAGSGGYGRGGMGTGLQQGP